MSRCLYYDGTYCFDICSRAKESVALEDADHVANFVVVHEVLGKMEGVDLGCNRSQEGREVLEAQVEFRDDIPEDSYLGNVVDGEDVPLGYFLGTELGRVDVAEAIVLCHGALFESVDSHRRSQQEGVGKLFQFAWVLQYHSSLKQC